MTYRARPLHLQHAGRTVAGGKNAGSSPLVFGREVKGLRILGQKREGVGALRCSGSTVPAELAGWAQEHILGEVRARSPGNSCATESWPPSDVQVPGPTLTARWEGGKVRVAGVARA